MQADSRKPRTRVEEESGECIGLIAGAGCLPAEVASLFRAKGTRVVAIGFPGITSPELDQAAHSTHWLELGQLDALAGALEASMVSSVLLVGKVPKSILISGEARISPDAEAHDVLARSRDRSDDGLLTLIAEWIEGRGFVLLDQSVVLAELLVPVGRLTRARPSERAESDWAVGWPVVEALGRSGVGQCVVVKDGAVLAVEAIEGTDETIRRAGSLGGPGATVIKALRAGQDRRFDLPAVGPDTIRVMVEVGAEALAVEAGAALILERSRCIDVAERAGIAIWGFDSGRLGVRDVLPDVNGGRS